MVLIRAAMARTPAFAPVQDTIDHFGTFVKPALYMAMYYALAQPRMDFTDAYIVTVRPLAVALRATT
jgi:hypothetical protein